MNILFYIHWPWIYYLVKKLCILHTSGATLLYLKLGISHVSHVSHLCFLPFHYIHIFIQFLSERNRID